MCTNTIPIIPTSFSFRSLQQSQFTWVLTNVACEPITGATVTSTLYMGRDRANPALQPGTVADPNFSNLPMTETPALSGIYIGIVPAAFNPASNPGFVANGFTVVITAYNGATLLDTWSVPAVIVPAQDSNDLVQLDDVKSWLSIPLANTDADGILQLLISSFSAYVVGRTGRTDLTSIQQYSEIYDGNGNDELFVNNPPIQSLISLTIASYNVPQSTATNASGIYVTQQKKSIAFRNSHFQFSPPLGIYPYYFTPGRGNIQVIYTGGYANTPYDLYECAMKVIAINYVRKDWKDIAANNLGVSGSTGGTRYRDWKWPPEVEEVLLHYQRWARP